MKQFSIHTFSKRLEELIKEKNLTLKKIAIGINMTETSICDWKNCKIEPKISSIVALANFFNVSVGYMAGVED